jgi:hypothetical protein
MMMEEISKEELWAQVQNENATTATARLVADDGEEFPEPTEDGDEGDEIDLVRLRSALTFLDPDGDDDHTWLAHRLGALVNAAKTRPDLHDDLFALAWQYSSGKLRGKAAKKWTKRAEGKHARMGRLSSVWKAFKRSTFSGKPATVRTIYFHARAEGWVDPADPFTEEGGE